MSLDVYLRRERHSSEGSGIFVRQSGRTKEISRAEWDAAFPGREPILFTGEDETEWVYSGNITHNLTEMAELAGLYHALWNPAELRVRHAYQLVDPLRTGLGTLKSDPKRFRLLNPSNGWGNYDGLVEFVEEYLAACEKYPDAEVSVSK